MFGRKARKQAEQEALKRMMEEAEANRRAAQAAAYATEQQAKVYYDSEIIFDENEETVNDNLFDFQDSVQDEPQNNDGGLVALPIHEDSAEVKPEIAEQQPISEQPAAQPTFKEEPVVSEPVKETVVEPVVETNAVEDANDEQSDVEPEPEVRYIVDGPTEDDELVKPAKLVKLPNLVDYMLSLKMSKRMKMNIATLLIGAYSKFKDIPEEKAIIVGCMKKVMFALMNS